MKSILDLAYGVLAGRTEAPKPAGKRQDAGPVARNVKPARSRPAPAAPARRGAAKRRRPARSGKTARGR